ncbi:MAG: hypothetical protein WBD20_20405 [Pirellulaceae bacterium]
MFDSDAMKQLIQVAKDHWRGCDWSTQFGPRKLDLAGIRSRQASLAAKATRGDEAICWKEAVRWLTEVEQDAVHASEFADQAFAEAKNGCWTSASNLFLQAEQLEAKYGKSSGYSEVREAFQRWIATNSQLK